MTTLRLPLKISGPEYARFGRGIADADGRDVAWIGVHRNSAPTTAEEGAAIAAHIVRCVNAHDDLLAALRWAVRCLESPGPHMDSAAAIERSHAAIAKTEGRS